MIKFLLAGAIWLLVFLPAQAQMSPNIERLVQALELPQIVDVMRSEGMEYGDELAQSMFPGRAEGSWQDSLNVIYDPSRMSDVALTAFARHLTSVDVDKISDFFESDLGREIISLEISARRALMDEAVDEANKLAVSDMVDQNHPRLKLIKNFINVNNLLENNVVGAMNSNFAFYSALSEGGAYAEPMSQEQILKEVWDQESDIRDDTSEWLLGFLTMAYSPLNDQEMQRYIDFSITVEGQAMNTALFVGFDTMFEDISRALGLAAAQIIASEAL